MVTEFISRYGPDAWATLRIVYAPMNVTAVMSPFRVNPPYGYVGDLFPLLTFGPNGPAASVLATWMVLGVPPLYTSVLDFGWPRWPGVSAARGGACGSFVSALMPWWLNCFCAGGAPPPPPPRGWGYGP